MNYDTIYMAKQALILSLVLSLPVIIIASVVGLLFSMFQALTQIQDQTLSFAIKLCFVIFALYLSIDWTAAQIYGYALMLYSQMTRI